MHLPATENRLPFVCEQQYGFLLLIQYLISLFQFAIVYIQSVKSWLQLIVK